jgi:hypothetical protein
VAILGVHIFQCDLVGKRRSRLNVVFDVNTIANYDPEIIPLLASPIGAAFERKGGRGKFVAVDFDVTDTDD